MSKKQTHNLAAFDFDGTITNKDSFNDFLFWTFGRRRVLLCYIFFSWAIILYLLRILPNETPKKLIFSYFFKGMKYREYKYLCQRYVNKRIPSIINATALARIYWHNEKGDQIVIVSASPFEWINQWAQNHPIEKVIATKEKERDSFLTGCFSSSVCYGEQKKEELIKFIGEKKFKEIHAYGDSRGDKQLLSFATHRYYRDVGFSSNVIITDGQWRKSLSAIRSIGIAHHKVAVIGESIFTTGFYSKFARIRFFRLDASIQSSSISKHITACSKKFKDDKKPVLIPMEEKTLVEVVNHKSEIEKIADILVPKADALAIALDKSKTMQIAKSLKIPVPETFAPKKAEELINILQQKTKKQRKNFILKPCRSQGSAGIIYNIETDFDIFAHWQKYGNLMLQERIPSTGEAIGTSFLFDNSGKLIIKFSHKRLQQYPNSGGPSTDRISINAPDLEEKALLLLKKLKWVGVAMVEWKIDPITREAKLLEINPRFWGSLELATRSGVDFASLYALSARNINTPPNQQYIEGIRCRWLVPGDILRFASQQKAQREKLSTFLSGLPHQTEEWNIQDLPGTIAACICPALLLISSKKYWHFLNRN